MGPPPEKTPRFRRAPNEKRARIIGAAHELFSRDGYGAATTAEIAKLAGVVTARQERKSARGSRFAFVGFSDPTGLYEATCFSEPLEQYREILEPGALVVITVEAEAQAEALQEVEDEWDPFEED